MADTYFFYLRGDEGMSAPVQIGQEIVLYIFQDVHFLNCYMVCVFSFWCDSVAVKNGVFWDVTPCGSCKNRRFGGA
jgi:hypothetical protein